MSSDVKGPGRVGGMFSRFRRPVPPATATQAPAKARAAVPPPPPRSVAPDDIAEIEFTAGEPAPAAATTDSHPPIEADDLSTFPPQVRDPLQRASGLIEEAILVLRNGTEALRLERRTLEGDQAAASQQIDELSKTIDQLNSQIAEIAQALGRTIEEIEGAFQGEKKGIADARAAINSDLRKSPQSRFAAELAAVSGTDDLDRELALQARLNELQAAWLAETRRHLARLLGREAGLISEKDEKVAAARTEAQCRVATLEAEKQEKELTLANVRSTLGEIESVLSENAAQSFALEHQIQKLAREASRRISEII